RCGGSRRSTIVGMSPHFPDVSQTSRPPESGCRVVFRTARFQSGQRSRSAIRLQTASALPRNRARHRATWVFGRTVPTTKTIAARAAITIRTTTINFMLAPPERGRHGTRVSLLCQNKSRNRSSRRSRAKSLLRLVPPAPNEIRRNAQLIEDLGDDEVE